MRQSFGMIRKKTIRLNADVETGERRRRDLPPEEIEVWD